MPRRVLVVEDDATIRGSVTEYLRDEGFEVAEARNGHEALAAVEATAPDVIVLDMQMPEMDGSAFLTARSEAVQAIPVVLVSANADLQRLADTFNVRAALAKPFDLDVLSVVIEQLLAHPETPPGSETIPAT